MLFRSFFMLTASFITPSGLPVSLPSSKSSTIVIQKVSITITKDLKYFKNLNYFIVDCLRYNKHPSHYCLEDVLELIKILKPQKTVLTNLHSDLDYKKLKEILPKNILPAYDGMSFVL